MEGNPVNAVDPTGRKPEWCQSMSSKAMYELCIDAYYRIQPINPFELGKYVTGQSGCYEGPSEYRAPGYIEGYGIISTTVFFPFFSRNGI